MKQDKLSNVKESKLCKQCLQDKNLLLEFSHDDNNYCDTCMKTNTITYTKISRNDLEKIAYRCFMMGKQDMWERSFHDSIKQDLDEVFK